MPRRYLLSIDSGGIRGVIPAMALAKLERTTGKLTRELFSFVAGTSTGAILAAAIVAGIPAARIVDFYANRTREIFDPSLLKFIKLVVFGSRYSTQKLHDLIADALGPARNWSLNDSPIDILMTAKRISDGMPWYFVRDNPRNLRCTGHLGLVDCTTASAAAPTYFQPWTISESSTPSGCEPAGALVDGALGVTGNPLYQACIEAFEYTPDYNPADTITVSLGTGKFKNRKEPKWIGAWAEWILAELLESPGEQQTEFAQRHFPQMTLYRIDTELYENIGVDHVNMVSRLLEYGEKLAETIDWESILAGTETRFRIESTNTLWEQYKTQVFF